MSGFSGFPKAGQQFFADLAANNNREWFNTNKQRYTDTVLNPSIEFIIALGERLKSISSGLIYDTRTNGSGSLMRINRDIRFSADKTPYNEYVAMMFWEGGGKKTENPGFGIRIGADGAGMMAGMHGFPKPTLERYRQAVDDEKSGQALVKAVKAVAAAGDYHIGGEHYKTVPRGYDKAHPRAELLKYAGLYVHVPEFGWDVLSSPDVVDYCLNHCQKIAPIQRWLVDILAS